MKQKSGYKKTNDFKVNRNFMTKLASLSPEETGTLNLFLGLSAVQRIGLMAVLQEFTPRPDDPDRSAPGF